MNSKKLSNLIIGSEDILMAKILTYAKITDYAKYTSTLAEAWRLSIKGISDALINNMNQLDAIPELGPDVDFSKSEMASFGVKEAQKHRIRGITIEMFLGFMKYYQQVYTDLINESDFTGEEKIYFLHYVKRVFDFIELGFITEWMVQSDEKKLLSLQDTSRKTMNEKNKYLTIFESIYDPIILIDKDKNIENINSRAAEVFLDDSTSGRKYYSDVNMDITLNWLKDDLDQFFSHSEDEILLEKTIETKIGTKTYAVKLKKMMDISEKFSGTVIIFYDISERLEFEKQLKKQYKELEYYAYTDPMTGALNRRTAFVKLDQEIALLSDEGMTLSVCFVDIDGLKCVNDTYGHTQGDDLIKLIILTMQSIVGVIDTICRMGGDEFLIIFPNIRKAKADKILKKIINKLAKYDQKSGKPYKHEFSYGIVEVPTDCLKEANEIVKVADQRMYQQKESKKMVNTKL
ncbi:MAG: diguanylate cyclase domain-containing protein [Lachnotalea sp.]